MRTWSPETGLWCTSGVCGCEWTVVNGPVQRSKGQFRIREIKMREKNGFASEISVNGRLVGKSNHRNIRMMTATISGRVPSQFGSQMSETKDEQRLKTRATSESKR